MKLLTCLVASTLAFLLGCANSGSIVPVPSAQRSYSGTASVGDFLSITIDSTAHTIAYTNYSNNDTGSVPYTVAGDGTFTINDPNGNFITAYEVPNYALVIQAAKTGPNHNTPALITAVESGQISLSTWAGKSYNYMQFRTAAGGVEIGSVAVDPQGLISSSGYWPYGAQSGSAFTGGSHGETLPAGPSSTYFKLPDGNGGFDYIFGTANGVFAVDTGNGALLGLLKASSKDFLPANAGTYKAIFYEKAGASTGVGNIETGSSNLGKATITISASGQITVVNSAGVTTVNTQLTPVADASYLVGTNKLNDPCFGLFTYRITTGSQQEDVFVSFMDRTLLFSDFKMQLPVSQSNTYGYLYGVGLK